MSKQNIVCPKCGHNIETYKNPLPTVDIIIEINGGIVLIKRKNKPFGWALPGGFVDYGESLESAAVREAKEETSLDIHNLLLLNCYSDPARDIRFHTITTVFMATGSGAPKAADDAAELQIFEPDMVPKELCFDHAQIIADYRLYKKN